MKDSFKILLVLALASCGNSKTSRDASITDGDGARDQQGEGDLLDADVKPDLSMTDVASTNDGPSVLPSLCNGDSSLALWVLVEPNNSRELPGSAVRVENGAPFFVLDGTCSVWTNGGWASDQLGRDREVRRAHLTASDVKELDDELSVQDYTVLADCMLNSGTFDVSVRAIRRGQHYARCPSSGVRFDRAWAAVASLAQSMWASGVPVDGPIHVSAVMANDAPPGSPAPYAWPLDTPLASFLLSPGKDGSDLSKSGASYTVTDIESTARLRSLRARYLADRSGQPAKFVSWDGMRVSDGETAALVYMRDGMPYEDTQGLLTF